MHRIIGSIIVISGVVFAGDSGAVTVENNAGGNVSKFEMTAKAFARAGVDVRIKGYCASSCTMYLMKKYGLKACAYRGATLEFHMPYAHPVGRDDLVLLGEEYEGWSENWWRDEWLGQFSDKLNTRLALATSKGLIPNPAKEGDTESVYVVKATDVLPLCKGDKA